MRPDARRARCLARRVTARPRHCGWRRVMIRGPQGRARIKWRSLRHNRFRCRLADGLRIEQHRQQHVGGRLGQRQPAAHARRSEWQEVVLSTSHPSIACYPRGCRDEARMTAGLRTECAQRMRDYLHRASPANNPLCGATTVASDRVTGLADCLLSSRQSAGGQRLDIEQRAHPLDQRFDFERLVQEVVGAGSLAGLRSCLLRPCRRCR